jgi:cell division protein FtsB
MFSKPDFVVRARNPSRELRVRLFIAAAWLVSLVAVGAIVARYLPREASRVADTAALDAERKRNAALEARIAMLTRSEQVAKAALGDLQKSLRDRDEEIDGLRADLAFYGRLLGGKREGLAVHALRVTQVPGSRAWNFIATLTQNFKRGDETSGRLSVAIEGVAAGKLATVEWKDLAQGGNVSGIAYAFKYFEQVRGTMMLPDGFMPNRVVVHAEGDGAHAEQSFAWADAVKGQESENVP